MPYLTVAILAQGLAQVLHASLVSGRGRAVVGSLSANAHAQARRKLDPLLSSCASWTRMQAQRCKGLSQEKRRCRRRGTHAEAAAARGPQLAILAESRPGAVAPEGTGSPHAPTFVSSERIEQ